MNRPPADSKVKAPVKAGPLPGLEADVAGPRQDSGRPTRLLLIIDDGFEDQAVINALRGEPAEILLKTPSEAIEEGSAGGQVDLVLLCCPQSGCRDTVLLTRITECNPSVPVIVVSSPTVAECPADGKESGPRRVGAWAMDAGRLLSSVRETLRRPKIKRLIRVSSTGGASFVARNARWLSDDLQARYSTPLPWSEPPVSIPIRFGETGDFQIPSL